MNEDADRKRSMADLLKHPLANVIIGFLLTGVLGTTLTQYYISQREKQSKQHELTTTRKQSIAEFAALNAEYLARAEMFLAAVDRGDAGSAKELKKMFDDATVRWRTETSATLMAARDVLPPEIYVEFREQLSAEFRERFLFPFGECLERGRKVLGEDGDGEDGDVATVLADCRAREYLSRAGNCSQALLDMFYELSGYTVGGRVEEALRVNRDKFRDAVRKACAPPAS
jgi:hypothetical protein